MIAFLKSQLTVCLFVVTLTAVAACDSDSSSTPPPNILNINNSLEPASPVGLAIEINGSSFQPAPGEVVFTEGTNVARITPSAVGWSDSGIVVSVPGSGSKGPFMVPGFVMVSVSTLVGTSTEIQLELVTTPVFSVQDVQWATTTSLPTALRGHGAVAIRAASTSAFVIVAGGNDGADNVATVLSNTLANDGQVGSTWATATPLPAPRAHHGMVAAHPGNSLVPSGSAFVYVIAGQQSQADSPGGTNNVYFASVSMVDGAVGTWTQTSPLPVTLVGLASTLYNNYIYIVGGLLSDGTPSSAVYSASVNSDGTLGSWVESLNPYPVGVAFATIFSFAGNLYVLGGDESSSTDPNEQGLRGVNNVRLAPILNGTVDMWVSTSAGIKMRKKHLSWTAFGQVLLAEGVYEGAPGSLELERSLVASDGTLDPWNGITAAANQINANVYNAAGFVSPIRPAAGGPRFLLLGGQNFSLTPPGALSSTVYYNTAP